MKILTKLNALRAFFMLCMFCSFQLFAQKNIEGTVKDSENSPLIGANVLVKGSNIGTVTNHDGKFSLSVPEESSTLIVSYIGYLSEEIEITTQKIYEIILIEDITGLDEIVVIGYGAQKKRDLTGAIATVENERIANIPATNLTGALQGAVAGLDVSTSSGRPGGGSDVLIRGVKSILGGNAPLVVIDGIIGGSLDDIHPADIEKVQVLKDAAATAIYGSRASAGVIIVTTKRGKSGKLTVNYNAYVGFSDVANKVDVVNVDEYIAKKREMWRMENSSYRDDEWVSYDSSLNVPISELLLDYEQEVYDSGWSYNWLDEVTRLAPIQSHNLSVSGGDEKTSYYLSMNMIDQKGIVLNSGLKRQSIRANVSSQFTDWLKVGTNILLNRGETSRIDNGDMILTYTVQLSPLGKLYDNESTEKYTLYPMHPDDYIANPLNEIKIQNKELNTKILNNTYLEFAPLTGLTYKISLNSVINYDKYNKFTPFRTRQVQAFDQYENASIEYRDRIDLNIEHLLSYYKSLGSHNFTGTFVFSTEEYKENRLYSFAKNFGTDYYAWTALEYGEVANRDLSSYEQKTFLVSYLGRFNYNYNSKYLIQFTLREDKSSKFSKENRDAIFPGVSAGWVASEESFLKNVRALDFLKFRLSWAKTGNQAIGYHDRFNIGQKVYYTTGNDAQGAIVEGLVPDKLANKDLRWETSEEINVGIDFQLLNNRLSGVVEFYKTTTTDLLADRGISPVAGFVNIRDNVGSLENKGVEISLNGTILNYSEFALKSYASFSMNKNKIIDLDGTQTDDITNLRFIGEPIGVVYDYEFDGILQEGEEAPYYMPYLIPGEAKVKNNGSNIELQDGTVERSSELDSTINEADKTIIGQIHPTWYGSIGVSMTYKNFDLSVFVNHVHGITRRIPINVRDRSHSMDIPYYTDENPSTQYGRPAWPRDLTRDANQYGYTSYYVDGSYTRLQDVTLAYNLKTGFLSKVGISSLRVYVTGQNLLTITDYMGFEPAIEYKERQTEGEVSKLRNYPTIKSYLFGLNLTF